jgi:AbrB family looped-hinge helix DNA binding protein
LFGKLEFFGSATVGERGQVVLPIELRKKMQLNTGDKLIAMGTMGDDMIILLKADFLTQILGKIEKEQNELRKILKDNTEIESNKDKELEII